MEKVIPNGTYVVILKKGGYCEVPDPTKFIEGHIISSEDSFDSSYDGCERRTRIYKVLGKDGNEYEATYGDISDNEYFIRTIEDNINHINLSIEELKNKRDELNAKIEENKDIVDSLTRTKRIEYIKRIIAENSKNPTKR